MPVAAWVSRWRECVTPWPQKKVDEWRNGALTNDALANFARSLVRCREMGQGMHPKTYTEQATCTHCGPIGLWFPGEGLGCPWCWNRVADRPIPRPRSVRCGDCIHFELSDHPPIGQCAKRGGAEPIAGLWGSGRRHCESFLQGYGKPTPTNQGP